MTFCKHYPNTAEWAAALRHQELLAGLGVVRLPALLHADPRALTITWQRIAWSRPLSERDLPLIADEMGRLHAAVQHARWTQEPLLITGWAAPRTARLRATLDRGLAPGAAFDTGEVDDVLAIAGPRPTCLYKDSNLRNYVVTHDDVLVTVDVDDLTLAPAGYDLAKLLLSWALTTGDLRAALVLECLAAYNRRVNLPVNPAVNPLGCTLPQLRHWLEVNYVLTAPYLGCNGYRHSWPSQRHRLPAGR